MALIAQPSLMRRQSGFTLLEVIAVIVILGIIGGIGSSFLIAALDAYRATDLRQRLTQRAGLTTEQMTRELRMAVPNSVRTSATGNCVEFLPIVAAAFYLNPLPTVDNGQSPITSIATSRFTLDLGTAVYAVVAPSFSNEVYTQAEPSALQAIAALGSPPYTVIPLADDHTFMRNSVTQRIFLVDQPVRFCVVGTTLVRYSAYGLLTTALSDADPGGSAAIMSHGVASMGEAFALSPGSEDRNIKIMINLRYQHSGQSLAIEHQVGLKNVP